MRGPLPWTRLVTRRMREVNETRVPTTIFMLGQAHRHPPHFDNRPPGQESR